MTTLLFGILNALRGAGYLPRSVMCAGMALLLYGLDYRAGLMFLALWGAFALPWSLSAITGAFNGKTALQDWEDKFKPSAWAIRRMNRMFIMDEYVQGAIGTAVRWMLFLPAVIVVHYQFVGAAVMIGVVLANAVGFIYYASGQFLRGTGYDKYATRLAEFISGCALGGALIV